MSWQLLDGTSRRPRVSWAVPEHLRESPRYGLSRRALPPQALDPDVLLQYIDNAISITENAQATKHLSQLSETPSLASAVASASLSSSSVVAALSSSLTSSLSAVSHPIKQVKGLENRADHVKPPLSSEHKALRFTSDLSQKKNYTSEGNVQVGVIPGSREDTPNVFVQSLEDKGTYIRNVAFTSSSGNSKGSKSQSKMDLSKGDAISKNDEKSSKSEEYDAQAADDAYRAAYSALTEGQAERALSLLHVASAKCPPDKHMALGKVHRLMAAAMQLVEKQCSSQHT